MSSPNNEPVGLSNTPFFVNTHKEWAVEQERFRHDQALYTLGEYAMFVLMWKVEDHLSGYVRRCPRCWDARASAIYEQPIENKCPMCYGTTFEGGVRAKIVRPALFSDVDDNETQDKHGTIYPNKLSVETTSDFRYRSGDYVFRGDGSRWQLAAPTRVTLRTGFGHPSQAQDSIGYSIGMATFEDRTNVAWIIPPGEDDLKSMLNVSGQRFPVAQTDIINAPLIPEAFTD